MSHSHSDSAPKIAVVGVGGVFPALSGYSDPSRLWAMSEAGRTALREVPEGRWFLPPTEAYNPEVAKPDHVYSTLGCFVDPVSPDLSGTTLSPDFVAGLDPLYHLTLEAGLSAFHSSNSSNVDRSRVGVILGNIALPTERASELAREYLGRTLRERFTGRAGGPPRSPLTWHRHVAGLSAVLLAEALGLGGTAYTLDAACASSLYAVKLAADELIAGRADVMLAGGASRPDCQYTQMGFSQLRALSATGVPSPFDTKANGLVVGEGAGVFVLRRLDDALEAGDTIWAILAGVGLSNDIDGGLLAPNSEGQLRAMRTAYENAGWKPSDVDYIECHATGTPLGDAVEYRSLRALWAGERSQSGCVLGSVKANVGHLLTGAGAAGLARVLFAMREQTLPPTAQFETPAHDIDLTDSSFRILGQSEEWTRRDEDTPRRAAISGFGFGGINAHLLLEEHAEGQGASRSRIRKNSGETSARILANPATGNGSPCPVAVVGIEAKLGPWASLDEATPTLLGCEAASHPGRPEHWWGTTESAWFHGLDRDIRGHFLDHLAVRLGRFRIPPLELGEMLPQQLLMLQTAGDLLDEFPLNEQQRERTGVFVGLELDLNTTNFHFRWALSRLLDDWLDELGITPSESHRERWLVDLREAAGPALSANRTMGALGSIVASRISREYRLGGPSFTTAQNENSGLAALQTAIRALQNGELDFALVGSVDLVGDVRNALALDADELAEGACALFLTRLEDAKRNKMPIRAVVCGVGASEGEDGERARLRACADGDIDPESVAWLDADDALGYLGASTGLASLVRGCLALEHRLSPGSSPRYSLSDSESGPRRLAVGCSGPTAGSTSVILEESPSPIEPGRVGRRTEALFVCEGDTADALVGRLDALSAFLAESDGSLERTARRWLAAHPLDADDGLAMAFVARDKGELAEQVETMRSALRENPDREILEESLPPQWRDRIFFTPNPLGATAELAFVYPGSGNDFPKMGADLAVGWPEVLRRQERENVLLRSQYVADSFWDGRGEPAVVDRIQAQVALGTLVTDVLTSLDVRPDAAIGYSLGESAALFALRAWRDRDDMLRSLHASTLFREDLTGEYRAARRTWNVPDGTAVDWLAGIVHSDPSTVSEAVADEPSAYLLLVNSPSECVVGGDRASVERVTARIGVTLMPVADPTSVHCPVLRAVADDYRELHSLPASPTDVRFYSAALGHSYEVTQDSAAEAILAQALDTVDFRNVIENAYEDGVRLFVEIGPGASCSRMIGDTLAGRPHRVRSACVPGVDGVSSVLRVLARLIVERVPFDLTRLYPPLDPPRAESGPKSLVVPVGGSAFEVEPIRVSPPMPTSPSVAPVPIPATPSPTLWGTDGPIQATVERTVATAQARSEAHSSYLRFASALRTNVEETLLLQQRLLRSVVAEKKPDPFIDVPAQKKGTFIFLTRQQCLAFGVGTIGEVLGADFAPVDAFPTRVRLPDEPLMLVDRILSVEGEPRSLTSGRVVTEHDIHPGAWYLDGGCIPTCVAVEAGQADLFLSGYLGIDFRTKGLAVYRLLDAVVTFHRHLPSAGQTIHYDIHIDEFFRQNETYLFRFRFEGTVEGEPLLTMTNGCAGFFTDEELDSGKGVVHTELDRRPMRGIEPDEELVPVEIVEKYDEARVDALRRGDLESAFGPLFAGKRLGEGLRLPDGRMRLVHRVSALNRHGGRFGVGLIRGEADIHPDDWFLTCHFVDDQVMPGTLMYECCLHTLRIFLSRIGWVDSGDVRCEPVPGVASRLKCRGQVIASTKSVTYEIVLKERGYRPEPYVICDALMYADGKPIVEITDMSLRMVGLDREKLRATWASPQIQRKPAIFDRDRITAFAIGKPSEAFGEPYRVFDQDRVIARLPGPPYQFLDRITRIEAEPWKMVAGGVIEAEYDIPPTEWYFEADRQRVMPFAVLLEVALQPCGWLAAYLGSALTSPTDVCFRNLGGEATLTRPIRPDDGTLTTTVEITNVSSSGGMILQNFAFEMHNRGEVVYRGTTSFGFFSREALAQQVGLREASPYKPSDPELGRATSAPLPVTAPFSDERWRMLTDVDVCVADGGQKGLGYLEGSIGVDPEAWFFAAHFYQDPVWPGSLGLEALLQLMKFFIREQWGVDEGTEFHTMLEKHQWLYRGQVIPTNERVRVLAEITDRDDALGQITADGWLEVDGRLIYHMKNFTVRRVVANS